MPYYYYALILFCVNYAHGKLIIKANNALAVAEFEIMHHTTMLRAHSHNFSPLHAYSSQLQNSKFKCYVVVQ